MAKVTIEISHGLSGQVPLTRIEIRRRTTIAALGEAVAAAMSAAHLTLPALAQVIRAALSATNLGWSPDLDPVLPNGPRSPAAHIAAARQSSASPGHPVVRGDRAGDLTAGWSAGPTDPDTPLAREAQRASQPETIVDVELPPEIVTVPWTMGLPEGLDALGPTLRQMKDGFQRALDDEHLMPPPTE